MKNKIEALTHLLGHGLNHLIESGKIDMDSADEVGHGISDFVLNGVPVRVAFYEAGHREFSITVYFDFDYDGFIKSRKTNFQFSYCPITCTDRKISMYAGATACCWVERKDGKWLQINKEHKPFGRYIRKSSDDDLMRIRKCNPKGFKLNGKFYF